MYNGSVWFHDHETNPNLTQPKMGSYLHATIEGILDRVHKFSFGEYTQESDHNTLCI